MAIGGSRENEFFQKLNLHGFSVKSGGRKKSQEQRVWEYLQAPGSTISSLRAREELGIIDLPKRISKLRQWGAVIQSRDLKVKNRFGETTRVKEYWIEQ